MLDDPYQVLGVSHDASEDEIKKAYHKAALKYHPDRQNGKDESEKEEAVKIFAEISEANDILTDPVKRYDWRQKHESRNGGTRTTKATTPQPKPHTTPSRESPNNRERSTSPSSTYTNRASNSSKRQSHHTASPPPSPMRSPRTPRASVRTSTSPRRQRNSSHHGASPSPSTIRSPRASVRTSTSPAPRRKRHSSQHGASPSASTMRSHRGSGRSTTRGSGRSTTGRRHVSESPNWRKKQMNGNSSVHTDHGGLHRHSGHTTHRSRQRARSAHRPTSAQQAPTSAPYNDAHRRTLDRVFTHHMPQPPLSAGGRAPHQGPTIMLSPDGRVLRQSVRVKAPLQVSPSPRSSHSPKRHDGRRSGGSEARPRSPMPAPPFHGQTTHPSTKHHPPPAAGRRSGGSEARQRRQPVRRKSLDGSTHRQKKENRPMRNQSLDGTPPPPPQRRSLFGQIHFPHIRRGHNLNDS